MDPMTIPAGTLLAEAWEELRCHPALMWVPPIWRVNEPDTATGMRERPIRHAVSAVDRNLLIDICSGEHGIEVRLATGPLKDRPLSNGAIDPTTPAATFDPTLTSVAPTFEQALVLLRDVVVRTYGTIPAAAADNFGADIAG